MSKGLPLNTKAADGMTVAHGVYKGLKREDAKKQLVKDLARRYEYDCDLIKGRFRNLESPGTKQKFSLKLYPGQTPIKKELVDGEVYEIPRMLARFINEGCYTWKYKESSQSGYGVDKGVATAMHDGRLNTNEQIEIREPAYRFAFIPMSYDAEDIGLQPQGLIIEKKA